MIARLFIILLTPPFMVFVFVVILIEQIGAAFRQAWIQCGIEFESVKRSWRAKSLKPEGER